MKIEGGFKYEITEKSYSYNLNMYSFDNNLNNLAFKDDKTSVIDAFKFIEIISNEINKGALDRFEASDSEIIISTYSLRTRQFTTKVIEYKKISC